MTINEIIKEIECEKGHLLKLIGGQQSVAPQSEAKRQSVEEQPIEELPFKQKPVEELPLEQHVKAFPFEDQVRMNSVTPQTDDQFQEQGKI